MRVCLLLVGVLFIGLFAGCAFQEDTETALEKEVAKSLEEQQPVEKIIETIQEKGEEQLQKEEQSPPILKEQLPVQEKASLQNKPSRPLDNIIIPSSPAKEARIHEGKITKVNPLRDNVHRGEITEFDTYRHYVFVSPILVIRGDFVTFTVKDDLATVIAKQTGTKATRASFTRDDAQPEGTILGNVRKVISQRDGTYKGIVRDTSGKEITYASSFYLDVGDEVYFRPGPEPVEIVKKIEVGLSK